MSIIRTTTIIAAFVALTAQAFAQTDPLPSWNETPTKQAIVAFVLKVTKAGSSDFVPEQQRAAVFDMNGTLVPEKPILSIFQGYSLSRFSEHLQDRRVSEIPRLGSLVRLNAKAPIQPACET